MQQKLGLASLFLLCVACREAEIDPTAATVLADVQSSSINCDPQYMSIRPDAKAGPVAVGGGEGDSRLSLTPQSLNVLPGCPIPGGPVGGGINPNDSYVSVNVARLFTTTLTDDLTGAVSQIQSAPAQLTIEAGYASGSGLPVLQEVYPQNPGGDDNDGVRVIRLVGNTAVEIGYDGAVLPERPEDLSGESVNVLRSMPDLGLFPSLIDVIVSGNTGVPPQATVASEMERASLSTVRLRSGGIASRADASHLTIRRSNASGSGANDSTGAEVAMSFQRSGTGDEWVLREVRQMSEVRDGGKSVVMTSTTEFRGVRVYRNPDADRRRALAQQKRFAAWRDMMASLPPVASAPAPDRISLSVPIGEGAMRAWSMSAWGRTGVTELAPPPSLPYPDVPVATPGSDPDADKTEEEKAGCTPDAFRSENFVPVTSSATRIVFQHGINSGPCTWSYPIPLLQQYAAGGRVVGKTSSFATYESQAASLLQQVPAGVNNWIFVGHSNGGVVSRYLAQTQPGLAKAVISINSPHAGAPVTRNLHTLTSSLYFYSHPATTIFTRRAAGYGVAGAFLTSSSLTRFLFSGGAVMPQMHPGSAFLTALNSRPETQFRRFAIRSEVDGEFQSTRVYCDMKASETPGVPLGRRCVKNLWRDIKRVSFKAGASFFLSWATATYIPVLGGLISDAFRSTGIANATWVSVIYGLDWVWRAAFETWAPSDAVVPMESQRWQGADAERVIYNADSHVGSTKSQLVVGRLQDLLILASQ